MELTSEQRARLGSWVEEGKGLSDIQKLLKEEFEMNLTFMDVRFLVSDQELRLKALKKQKLDEAVAMEEGGQPEPPGDEYTLEEEEASSGKGVSVEVDKVVRPGATASGSVTFSNGKKAEWHIDQYGQLGIVPPEEGFQPPEADIQEFQVELRNALQRPSF